jgi:hypothetical protein
MSHVSETPSAVRTYTRFQKPYCIFKAQRNSFPINYWADPKKL